MVLHIYDFFLMAGIIFSLYLLYFEIKMLHKNKHHFSNTNNNIIKPLAVFGILFILTAIVYGPTITGNTTLNSAGLNSVTQKVSESNSELIALKNDIFYLKEIIEVAESKSPGVFDDRDALIELVNRLQYKANRLSNNNDDLKDKIKDLKEENNKIYSMLVNSGGVS